MRSFVIEEHCKVKLLITEMKLFSFFLAHNSLFRPVASKSGTFQVCFIFRQNHIVVCRLKYQQHGSHQRILSALVYLRRYRWAGT